MPPIPMSVHLAAVFEREALEEAHWEAFCHRNYLKLSERIRQRDVGDPAWRYWEAGWFRAMVVESNQCLRRFVDDAHYDMPLIYHVEGRSLYFGRAEFSLVTALHFRTVSFRLWRSGHVNFVSRVLPNKVGVKVTNLDLVGVIEDEKLFGDLSDEDRRFSWVGC
ncbi:hypothetical protein Tco_1425197 [Tanacetum coccineum]